MTPYYSDDAVQLFHGDCREILPTLGMVDHVITDPPYGRDVYIRMGSLVRQDEGDETRVGQGGRRVADGGGIMKMAAGDIGHIDDMLDSVAAQICRLTRRWAIVFSDVESCGKWRTALTRQYWEKCRTVLIAEPMRYVRTGAWVKPDAMPQMSGDRPAVGFEPCTICHAAGRMRWNGGGSQATWTYNTAKGAARPDHPCPKPEALMGELVTQFTDSGDLILDPFGGSGTTAVAAKRLGRRCILIEREEKYCEIAARRLSQSALDLFGSDADSPAVAQKFDLHPSDERAHS